MDHFGDITKINGCDVPLVHIVCGGSPCQDLSVAGLRKGLSGERSGLFMEQIRIIKEMRNESIKQLSMRGAIIDNRCIQPRFMVWENVPGVFSSNNGEDFRAVLEETAKVVCEDAVIPMPDRGGRWSHSGCIMGDGWSIAWRVHDAQFWGVPQRRKRIALVADFGGESAPEILFERKSVSGDIKQSREKGQRITADAQRSVIKTDGCLNGWDIQSKHIQSENGKAEALYSGECRYGGGESYVMQSQGFNGWQSHQSNMPILNESTPTIEATMPPNVYCLQGNGINRSDNAGCGGKGWRENECYTLNTIDRPAICVSQDAYDKYSESDKSATIKQSGGIYGGAAKRW